MGNVVIVVVLVALAVGCEYCLRRLSRQERLRRLARR